MKNKPFNIYPKLMEMYADMKASEIKVTPQMFGAVGDGVTDDSDAFISAVSSASGGTLIIPDGTYLLSKNIFINANTKIIGGANTIIKRAKSESDSYKTLCLWDVENVHIENINIVGERKLHTGTTGENGMCLSIYGSKNVYIKNCTFTDGWGDGVYIGTGDKGKCENVKIIGCHMNNNRRQGISVINCDGLMIKDCIIENTNGTLPQAGIDFECNNDNESCVNVLVENCTFNNNAGGGLILGNDKTYQIKVVDCTFTDDIGIVTAISQDNLNRNSYLHIMNCTFNNTTRCIEIKGKSKNGAEIIISDCDFSCENICVEMSGNAIQTIEYGGIDIINCKVKKLPESTPIFRIMTYNYHDINIDMSISKDIKMGYVYFMSDTPESVNINLRYEKPFLYKGNLDIARYAIITDMEHANEENVERVYTFTSTLPTGCKFRVRKTTDKGTLKLSLANGTFKPYNKSSIVLNNIFDEVIIKHETQGVWSVIDNTYSGLNS